MRNRKRLRKVRSSARHVRLSRPARSPAPNRLSDTAEVCGACAGGYHEACRGRHVPCACRATHLCGNSATGGLLAAVAACESRRLALLEEIRVNAERHRGAVRALVDTVGREEAARLLGVSRQQVWRLSRVQQ